MLWREQVNYQWDDDEVRFVLDYSNKWRKLWIIYFILDTTISEESVFKQVYSSTCSTNELSISMTKILHAVKGGLKVYQSSWKYQVLHIARLALNNNHSLHYLFTKPYFLWFLNIFMIFTYFEIKHVYKFNWTKRPSYIPPMLMLKIYRPRWTLCDYTLHDPLGLVMVR
jgi:hypothetical protein